MNQYELFSILDSVDSTNNYAMGRIHAGLAKHGMAWFAGSQTAGKGQRGKSWQSKPGENILLSIAVKPPAGYNQISFHFNAAIALTCARFMKNVTGSEFKIKWPNDIYWNDRKAGGILIENILRGNSWNWSVIGIGININETDFPEDLKNPVSAKMITGENYDSSHLGKMLYAEILDVVNNIPNISSMHIIQDYNELLYKRNESVLLLYDGISFKAKIKEVDQSGQLVTLNGEQRKFNFGEVEWISE